MTKTYSEAGLALTKSFEGLNLAAYVDQRGVWTVGYGHTGPNVHVGLQITEEEAEVFLESEHRRCRRRSQSPGDESANAEPV